MFQVIKFTHNFEIPRGVTELKRSKGTIKINFVYNDDSLSYSFAKTVAGYEPKLIPINIISVVNKPFFSKSFKTVFQMLQNVYLSWYKYRRKFVHLLHN